MNEDRSERPVDALARAVYQYARLSPVTSPESLALAFRDRLKVLTRLGSAHRAFVQFCAYGPKPIKARDPDPAVVEAFRNAGAALQGERLATLDAADVRGLFDGHLQEISACLSRELFAALERELDAGRIDRMQRVGATIGRFTGRRHSSPMDVMTEVASERRESSTDVEFIIESDVPFLMLRRHLRRLGQVQRFDEKATPPLRQFLRLVTGKRYRADDDLAEGECRAVVLFHYVLDNGSDQTLAEPDDAPGGIIQRLRRLAPVRASAPLLVLIVLAACLIGLDYRRNAEVTRLESQVQSLERKFTGAATPASPELAPPSATDGVSSGQLSDLEERLATLEQRSASPSATAEVQRLREALDRLEQEVARDNSPPPAGGGPATAEVLAMAERLRSVETENERLREELRGFATTLASLQRDAATAERLSAAERRMTADDAALRKDVERVTADLAATRTDVSALRVKAVTAEQVAEIGAQASADTKVLRTDVERLATRVAGVVERFDRLEQVLSGEAAGSSPALPAAQVRYQLQHTPSQLVIDELHRLMESEEPYEKTNLATLLKERWNTLWSASESVEYPIRATMMIEEIATLAGCNMFDTDPLVLEQMDRLINLPPAGDRTSIQVLVALTFNIKQFGDKHGPSFSFPNRASFHERVRTLLHSIGQFVETQRLSALKEHIGQAAPETATVSQTP